MENCETIVLDYNFSKRVVPKYTLTTDIISLEFRLLK